MDADTRWLRIKQLFHESQTLPESERDAWLCTQCGTDESLLAEARTLLSATPRAPDILDDGAIGVLKRLRIGGAADDLVGRRLGVYRLLRLVGEGGMGSVFLAEREGADFVQRVALKLVRADMLGDEARAGFLRERSVLARLSHPHIAQLHDGGVTPDGTPYFTLEYVEGEPITRYCERHGLDLRARLRLALQVCAAVEYAHRSLIVHRDIKPSNILVTADGEVKLLDFGIAKLLDAESSDRPAAMTQSRMMTPQYAAPEQVLGDAITTATDVYAIGVLVYELCSGRLPYQRAEAGTVSWSKAVVEDAPETLHRALDRSGGDAAATATARATTARALRRALRGDLDRIVQRALAKTPESRYPSVAALATDLRRYVEGRAISGGSRSYRLRMFVRRNWLPLGAAAAIALTLIGSGIAVVWQAHEKERAAQTTLAVKDFLYGLFTAVDPREAKGRVVSARELVDRGAERIAHSHALEPDQKAEIEATLGRLYYQLGVFDRANALQEDAAKLLAADASHALLFARVESEHADTLNDNGDVKAAALLAMDARARLESMQAPAEDRAKALHAQARIALAQRDFRGGKQLAEQELALVRSSGGDRRALYGALMTSGGAAWGMSAMDESMKYFSEALEVASRDAGPDDLDVARAQTNVGITLQQQSRYAEALEIDQKALATFEKILGADHPLAMTARRDIGLAYKELGDYVKSRAAFEQVIAAQRAKLGNDNPAIAGSDINYGNLLLDAGDLDGAERAEREALEIFERKNGRDFQGVRIALGNLAAIHMKQGDYAQAKKELDEVSAAEVKLKLDEIGMFMTTYRIGELTRLSGHAAEAVPLQRMALAAALKQNSENTRFAAMVHYGLGLALRDSGDIDAAVSELRATLASYAGFVPNGDHPRAADVHYDLGELLAARPADHAEGIRELERALSLRERFFGVDDRRTLVARAALSKAATARD